MEKIKILYIDDQPDSYISEYLDKIIIEDIEITSNDLKFELTNNYENLLNDKRLSESNIVIIDSNLFENRSVENGKFTGEEFKIILKKVYPFIEVIVITQNKVTEKYGTITKFNSPDGSAFEYYDKELKPIIEKKIKDIIEVRIISKKFKENKEIEKVLVEKVLNSMLGVNEYDDLKSSDIKDLINEFKKIEKNLK